MRGNILVIVVIICLIVIGYFALSSREYQTEADTNPILDRIRRDFSRLNPEYGRIPLKAGKSAFTENKSMITICTHDPETGKPYHPNTLNYVANHELAHMISGNYGHGPEFIKNFSTILRKAACLGTYDPSMAIPSTYCGVKS